MTHAQNISTQLKNKPNQVSDVLALLDDGNTIPFMAPYRKELTGSLNDEQIRIIADELVRLRSLDERRATILSSIEEQGKLTDELQNKIDVAYSMTALQDLYAPYKKKRRTHAMVPQEKGLEPLDLTGTEDGFPFLNVLLELLSRLQPGLAFGPLHP